MDWWDEQDIESAIINLQAIIQFYNFGKQKKNYKVWS